MSPQEWVEVSSPLQDESARMTALRRLAVLDTPVVPELDELVGVLARTFGTQSAAVSLVDSDRQWFKATVGIGFPQTPRAVAFCDHTIRQEGVLIVEDATKDDRFASNPLVVGDPGIRFYAGAPVRTTDGQAVGSLCVFDPGARPVNAFEQEVLLLFAQRVGAMLELAAPISLPSPRGEVKPRGDRATLVVESLSAGRLGVAYQPVYDLGTGRVVAAEALLRLRDASGKALSAEEVITAAESSGSIVELGRQVLSMAAAQAARWRADHGLLVPVAVNVSALQLSTPGFRGDVLRSIARAGIPPQALSLELTESVLLDVGSPGVAQLRELADDGVALAIDDFGTGYASLTYLRDLPARTLKIDRSFVAGIPSDHRDTAIVAGVIGLAKNFGLACIAEGIETSAQLDFLAARGVLGQGYLLGRPMTGEALGALLPELSQVAGLVPGEHSPARERDDASNRRYDAGNERDHAGARRDRAGDRRDEAGDRRDEVADRRDDAGDERDAAAELRDEVAAARDRAGAKRDAAAERRDRRADKLATAARSERERVHVDAVDDREEAAADRRLASVDRAAGASERVLTWGDRATARRDRTAGADARSEAKIDRNIATADRGSGAGERVIAGGDRSDSQVDRVAAAHDRRSASFDELTGLYNRDTGLRELARQVVKSHRGNRDLVLALVDADGLKHSNDTLGHAAGDQLLITLAEALAGHVREYDLVVRLGGDEFLCVMPDMDLAMATDRLERASGALANRPGSFTYGLALLTPDDTAASLIARADAAMYDKRKHRHIS